MASSDCRASHWPQPDPIYVYGAFIHSLPRCVDARSALVRTYSQAAFPTVMAVCTTIVGIISLVVTPIGAVRAFSILACLGIVTLLVALVTVFPCLHRMKGNQKIS